MPRNALATLIFLSLAAPGFASTSFQYLPSPNDQPLERVIEASAWQERTGGASLGYSNTPHWLRWQVPDDGSEVAIIHNSWLNDFELFFVRGDELLVSYHTGGAHPVSSRPIRHPEFAFPIPSSPRPDSVYVRHATNSALLYPLQFATRDELMQDNAQIHAWHGMYYGLGLIMLLYNLVIYRSVRDRAYLYFVAYAGALMAYLATSDGFAQLYLWPDSPSLQHSAPPLLMAALLIFGLQFSIHFLEIRKHAPTLVGVLRVGQLAAAINGALVFTFQNAMNTLLEPVMVMVFGALLVTFAAVRAIAGDVAARVFLVATGVMAVAGFFAALTVLGWIPETSMGRQAAWLGSAIELSMLSLALAWLLRRREQDQQRLRTQSESLQRRVKELQTATGLAEEHRQLQKAMQQAQKLKTIGQMAGGFAHDFNNILATILGFAELALDTSKRADRQKQTRYLEEIRLAGERGAELVKQLLTYSRGAAKEPQEINLNETLAQAGNLLRGSLPTTVTINVHDAAEQISCDLDPGQIQQALVNLALNASDAMDQRGTIDIRVDQPEVDDLRCSSCGTRFAGSFVRIKVEDTGRGFTGNAHELFTPFFTTKPIGHGSGLGLSVVHGIVHEHHGHLQLSNRGQRGARCSIYLPTSHVSQTTPVAGKRILLIEDDPSVARYLESLFGENDFAVTSVRLPTQALAQFMAKPDDFSLVITDQIMPHGTGIELAEDIHELRPELPVIMATANPREISEDDMLRAGIKALFGKPIESELLLAKVRGLLRSHG